MRNIQYVKTVIIFLLLNIPVAGLAQEKYCCERAFIFPGFPMPSEQERDISDFISTSWDSYIIHSGIHELLECPLRIELLSYTGVVNLDSMIERITSVATGKPPDFDSQYETMKKRAEYIWKGQLELTYIERIVPGWTEPAYGGGTEYLPGYVVGGWKFTIQLYDIQHNAVVKEASTTWTGSDIGYYKNLEKEYNAGTSDRLKIDILEELYEREFHNLKQIIWEYEKVPDRAEFESDIIEVDPEQTKRITFNVTDEKGEKPQKWQRLAVKVDFGTLINGTPCCDVGEDAKFYSFMCREGQVTIEYKAPDHDKATFDHLTVYNGCHIKDPETLPMTIVDIQDEIGAVDIALVNEGYSGTITITKSWDYTEDFGSGSIKHVGTQIVSFNVIFKPIPQMEGLEGQPITIFGPDKVSGTWSHNEDRYCSGDCDCSGLDYQEFGSGDFPGESLQGLILITNLFPTDNKVVADQLGQFGLTSWYDIATPTEY
ncbi:MAG: hypothetical protein RBS37_13730, partial [Bacteroidales bacterium]|nr:hypothetical protein [Bacteroidales bacterium]